jgi:hypothetical protein
MTDKAPTIEPVEIMPRQQWLACRFIDVRAAIIRRRDSRLDVPREWLDEFFDLALAVIVVHPNDKQAAVTTGWEE